MPQVQWDMHNLFALQFSPLSGDKLICTWKWAVTGGAAASLEGKISLGLRKGCFWHSWVVVGG